MTILDYGDVDLLFAHWMKRKREIMREHQPVPWWIDGELDRLRPIRNPNCSLFILDGPYGA